MEMIFLRSKRKLFFLLTILVIISQSCGSIRLISEYDEITDKTVVALQEKVAGYFVKLERTIGTEASKYENNIEQFDAIKIDINTLEVRTAALDKNRIIQQQVEELRKMVDNLERLHRLGITSYDQVKALKHPFNTAFTSIIKLQMALKRGKT